MAKVPSTMVEEYAETLFQDYGELLEIPENVIRVQHDADDGYYDFGLGDNPYVDEMTDPIFYYSVRAAEKL